MSRVSCKPRVLPFYILIFALVGWQPLFAQSSPGPQGGGATNLYHSIVRPETGLSRENHVYVEEPDILIPSPQKQGLVDSVISTVKTAMSERPTQVWQGKKESENSSPGKRTESASEMASRKSAEVSIPKATRAEQKKENSISPKVTNKTNPPERKDTSTSKESASGGVEPTERTPFKYRTPDYYQGIYLNNATARTSKKYQPLLKKAKSKGINCLVVDVQPRLPDENFIKLARESGFYLVARVVVFEGGLKTVPPPEKHLEKVYTSAEEAAKNGFMEIQLDYIRFADRLTKIKVSRAKRYETVAEMIKGATDRLRPLGVRVGGDIFGRIAFNKTDEIGQRVELFSSHLDTIYPMLYPSHFYGEPKRIKDPYTTILLGVKNCLQRSYEHTKIVAYIQGFHMSVKESGLTYKEYIKKQVQASKVSGGHGYIVWNAKNDYDTLFDALDDGLHTDQHN